MITDDSSTLTLPPPGELTGPVGGLTRIPALTIVWHPDLERVGDVAPLMALLENDVAPLTRRQPIFQPPGSGDGRPIGHNGMNRDPAFEVWAARDIFELRRGKANASVEVDGLPFDGTRRLSADDLRRGLILTVGGQFVFCLHFVHFPIMRGPSLGLLGTSDPIEDVRRSIRSFADDKSGPVLLRGETGTGKELAALALHGAGPRRAGPFVGVNMSVLRPERAAADLFGYQKGAFTGATADHPGHFRAAAGGTVFFDEIGLASLDVQAMLLRVVEDRIVQPLGSAHTRKVDVRIIAATDMNLEQAVSAGRFLPALYHRVDRADITLPPLRDRREDIGVLLVHFLRTQFTDAAEPQRLQGADLKRKPWLSARDVAALALSPWSGNVRSLAGLAEKLVAKATGPNRVGTHAVIAEFLNRNLPDRPIAEATPARPATAREITSDQLLEALDSAGWSRTRAAELLKVPRSTFWRWLGRYPDLRRVADLPMPEILRAKEACGGDLDVAARKLRVSATSLARRLARRR
jgi:two-component system nitrogen regulation response regulator GlnG